MDEFEAFQGKAIKHFGGFISLVILNGFENNVQLFNSIIQILKTSNIRLSKATMWHDILQKPASGEEFISLHALLHIFM